MFKASFNTGNEFQVRFGSGQNSFSTDISEAENRIQAEFENDSDLQASFGSGQNQFDISLGHGSSGGDLPPGGLTGDLLAKRSNGDGDVEWITPANNAEQDNTRPITAAAVYVEIGNINALLASI